MKNILDSSISSIKEQNIFNLSSNNIDIIAIENKSQNIILIGNINNENNLYEIKYILDYDSNYLNEEKKILLKTNIDNYIQNNMIFDKKRKNDYISPIFSDNIFIGYCYKYISNFDYNSCMNYYNLLTYERILNPVNIYLNYKKLQKIVENKLPKREKYYLINNNFIKDLKKNNDFRKIFELMEKNNISNNNKIILSAIKT